MNLGVCTREHSSSVQKDFQCRGSRREKLMYSSELLRDLEDLERDLHVKVRANEERIEEAERVAMHKEEVQQWQRKIDEKKQEALDLLAQAEVAADADDVDLVEQSVRGMDDVKTSIGELEYEKRRAIVSVAGVNHGRQVICDACGSITAENDKAGMERHLAGKYHLGWVALKQRLFELREMKKDAGNEWPTPRGSSGGERGRDRDRERDRDRGRDRDRERDRDRDRGRGRYRRSESYRADRY